MHGSDERSLNDLAGPARFETWGCEGVRDVGLCRPGAAGYQRDTIHGRSGMKKNWKRSPIGRVAMIHRVCTTVDVDSDVVNSTRYLPMFFPLTQNAERAMSCHPFSRRGL